MSNSTNKTVTVLDYGAGNVRSLRNAITSLGYSIIDVTCPNDIEQAERIIFPGVGSFEAAIHRLKQMGLHDALRAYLLANRPFFGICIGMQVLFESSTEAKEGSCPGLGIIPGHVSRFAVESPLTVPHIGWNGVLVSQEDKDNDMINFLKGTKDEKFYFVHSYRALATPANREWIMSITDYGERFISSIHKGNIYACQFHPEKSSTTGLECIRTFLTTTFHTNTTTTTTTTSILDDIKERTVLSKRIVACLDVRTNDDGDLVVTKGDQYDVREKPTADGKGAVRNLGKPVELAHRYYLEGADEVTFLNITSFRDEPLKDAPMLKVLEATSTNVFVPLCIGGGIRDYTDSEGHHYSALDVAAQYFRSGADKVSIGSDSVIAAEQYYQQGKQKTGQTSIEQISHVYGAQAVVVSVDPRRVYVSSPSDTRHRVIKPNKSGPNGEEWAWYQCTIKGGREGRDVDVFELCSAVEALGAGEILLNSMDTDGTKQGFDIPLLDAVSSSITIPVIASSGAGSPSHFHDVFRGTRVTAALAAGIFHRREVPLESVKQHLQQHHIPIRTSRKAQ